LRNSRISSRKGLVMESDFKNMIMIAVIVNIVGYLHQEKSSYIKIHRRSF
jgi:hypothetical protein